MNLFSLKTDYHFRATRSRKFFKIQRFTIQFGRCCWSHHFAAFIHLLSLYVRFCSFLLLINLDPCDFIALSISPVHNFEQCHSMKNLNLCNNTGVYYIKDRSSKLHFKWWPVHCVHRTVIEQLAKTSRK